MLTFDNFKKCSENFWATLKSTIVQECKKQQQNEKLPKLVLKFEWNLDYLHSSEASWILGILPNLHYVIIKTDDACEI